MEKESLSLLTVVLETNEPFGPEARVMHEKATGPEEAALRALHRWHNDMDFNPNNTVEELEDGTPRSGTFRPENISGRLSILSNQNLKSLLRLSHT